METFETIAIAFSVVILGLLLVGCYLVVRDTIRQKGVWAINLRPPTECPMCGFPVPLFRIPKNRNQALWGGCTCSGCGCEYDRWGELVAKQSFPAKIDEQPKQPNTNINRRDEPHA